MGRVTRGHMWDETGKEYMCPPGGTCTKRPSWVNRWYFGQ